MNQTSAIHKTSQLFASISQPARILILLAIGEGEACVCHLETLLGYRQAYISQHLMALREAGVVKARRDGRYAFYRLKDTHILNLIHEAASLAGTKITSYARLLPAPPRQSCKCPECAPDLTKPGLTLQETG